MNCFDFNSQDNQNVPKYTIHVVDSETEQILSKNNCAAFIVP